MSKYPLIRAWLVAQVTLACLNMALYHAYHTHSLKDTLLRIALQGVAVAFVLFAAKDPLNSKNTEQLSQRKTYGVAGFTTANTVNSYRKLVSRLCSLGKTASK